MTQLTWNGAGTRLYETGVDRGVLYLADGSGVAWSGLTGVKESSSNADTKGYYLDGIKYLNIAGTKEFKGNIEAYTYPEEFAEYDGWIVYDNGVQVDEQKRKQFGFSYRTRIGNDLEGYEYGYKIHIVYNALANPSDSSYSSMGDDLDPITFSWDISTTPIKNSHSPAPVSHIVVDSTKTNDTQLRFIEEYLYGSATQSASLPSVDEILDLFVDPLVTMVIQPNTTTGIAPLVDSTTVFGDLRGRRDEGIYVRADNSRLYEPTPGSGIYKLGS